jgi:hypothetical protein
MRNSEKNLAMTDEQILQLAESCGITPNKYKVCIIWKEELLKFAQTVCENDDFYKTRCELLQKVQRYMRDPERQIVCDILANNSLLPDPSGVRYGQDLMKLIETYD